MPKALVLFSGGLDSLLAARMMQGQPGLDVEGIHFSSLFTSRHDTDDGEHPALKAAEGIELPLRMEENSEALLKLVRHPKHGYGSNMNPCIDCRIRNVRRAAEVMRESGADFLVTGEVVGERPMSQNRGAMRLIEKETGMAGLLVRPLSAKLLDATIPEERGWVDRERLLGIHGRSRKPQMALARDYGIREYATPAGGCLLTDPGFSARLRDLIEHDPACDLNDCLVLKFGRHFRAGSETRIVVGRDERENDLIMNAARAGDLLMAVATHPGPLTLVRGRRDEGVLGIAGAITARYGKARALERVCVMIWNAGESRGSGRLIEVAPAGDDAIRPLRIGQDERRKGRRGGRVSE